VFELPLLNRSRRRDRSAVAARSRLASVSPTMKTAWFTSHVNTTDVRFWLWCFAKFESATSFYLLVVVALLQAPRFAEPRFSSWR